MYLNKIDPPREVREERSIGDRKGWPLRSITPPQQDDLLWVYEGLTQYYGNVLATRAGFRTPQDTLDEFVFEIYNVDVPGRRWRNLQDTADASPILRGANSTYESWRRGQDYYREGALLWLEAHFCGDVPFAWLLCGS